MSKKRFTEDSWRRDPWCKALVHALHGLKTKEEIENFLRDVGTLSELQAWSERFEVCKQLSKGLTYRQVAKNTGASTTTVTRVAKFLENGEGGYRKVLKAHRHHRTKPDVLSIVQKKQQEHVTEIAKGENQNISVLQKYLGR